MANQNKLLQALGIPFSALVSVIFGLMVLSFPLGAYVIFNSKFDDAVSSDFPMRLNFSSIGVDYELPIDFELGEIFIIFWSGFVILFTIAAIGPKNNFLKVLSPVMAEGRLDSKLNYLVSIIKWFTILIFISFVIDSIQQKLGITIDPPVPPDILIQFFNVTAAPFVEEIGFRVILIGIPLFLMYSQRTSVKAFFKCLWNPTQYKHIFDNKRPLVIIVITGTIFGAAHIMSEDSWSAGKFAQATASGIILGWIYFKYGFITSVLVHWATNYFVFSYVYFLAEINEITVKNAFSHSLTNSLEILLIITGVLSISLLILQYVDLKKIKLQKFS